MGGGKPQAGKVLGPSSEAAGPALRNVQNDARFQRFSIVHILRDGVCKSGACTHASACRVGVRSSDAI